jgi:hypothetical protein
MRLYAARKRLRKQMGHIEENLNAARPSGDPQFAEKVQRRLEQYKMLAEDLLEAYRSGDAGAMQRFADHTGQQITWDRLRENMQLALGKVELTLADAQLFFAHVQSFTHWEALAEYIVAPPAEATIIARPVKLFHPDEKGAEQTTGSARDWETVIGLMKEQRIPGLNAAFPAGVQVEISI